VRRNLQHLSLLSQTLPHFCFNHFVTSETFTTKAAPLYATNTSQRKKETFLYEYPALSPFAHNKTLLFSSTPLKHSSHFDD
jgi:hypothetical protein